MLNIVPDKEEFHKGIKKFEKHEKRDAMYKVATFLVSYFWGKPSDMADGLGVLLLTWNQAFYRYGIFDFDILEKSISKNLKSLVEFRKRDITTLSDEDEDKIRNIFDDFIVALQIATGKSKGKKSPVSISKALHLLAPDFFPLWDDKIARAYGCYYGFNPAEKYISFCKIMRWITKEVKGYIESSNKSILKLIDEYNYSKYTKGWI
ncbi:hypothetical protein KA005_14970 [bacterium]|nr:hypothetical protein [bacterium]